MVLFKPSSNLIFGLQLIIFFIFFISGYTLIASSFLSFILPNKGLPFPIFFLINKINFFILIGLPEPKLNILQIVKLRKERNEKNKKKKFCKYLDQLYDKNDTFLKEYFEEK